MPGRHDSQNFQGFNVLTVFRPADADAVQEVVSWAVSEGESLEVVGGGSKRALGRPMRTAHTLDLSGLSGVVDYDPAELVLTVRPATPMAEVGALLAGSRQMLAFEPPDLRGLLPSDREPTMGGMIACNLAGPRRVRAGAARDHFLGFSAVNGWGDEWKSGGRVVKNVTGYDLCKVQAGALGTLSALTELSVRVLPRPEMSCSLVVAGLEDGAAIEALAMALNSPHEVTAAAHLPRAAAGRSGLGVDGAVTVLRLEGPRPSVDFRAEAMLALLGGGERLDGAESEALWVRIGAVQPLLASGESIVWRVTPTPSGAPGVLARVRAALPSAEAVYDWGGGLLWIALDAGEAGADCGAAVVRGAVALVGGHAMLLRAPEAVRAVVPPFQPSPGPLEALTRRVKASFDPNAILNPGRMQDGI